MKIDVKEPSQYTNGKINKKLFQKGRPYGYYRKRTCVYNSDSVPVTFCGRTESSNCTSCNKEKKRNCAAAGNNSCFSNERCARLMKSADGLSPYTDVCMYEKNDSGIVKRQPIPRVKTITAPRNVYNNSTTYKKQKYSYSMTEMLRTQKTSYKEQQKRIPYNVCTKCNCNCDFSTKQ